MEPLLLNILYFANAGQLKITGWRYVCLSFHIAHNNRKLQAAEILW